MNLHCALRRVLLAFGLATLPACFEDSTTPEGPAASTGSDSGCTPGMQVSCDCPGALGPGVQQCSSDGAALGPCECPDDDSASTTSTATGPSTTGPGTTGTTSQATTSGETSDGTTEAPPATTIVLFASDPVPGDFTGGDDARTAADDLCKDAQMRTEGGCTNTRAVFCADPATADDIRNMQTTYSIPADRPVISVSDNQIAMSWQDLVSDNAELDNSLESAMVTNVDPWTGTDLMGNCLPNCAQWTTTDGATTVGDVDVQDAGWKSTTNGMQNCAAPRPLLCACW